MMRIYSWNVNGIRAASRKGFFNWLRQVQPDIVCIQETKAHPDQLDGTLTAPDGYDSVWHSAERRGYSGVAAYFKKKPLSIAALGVEEFDREGRVQLLEYPDFVLVNAYFPNSQPERARLDFKLTFCDAILTLCQKICDAGKNIVVCGDFNIAHREIDLARPKENEDTPGFYPEERAAMDRFIRAGYADSFRCFNKEPGHYTWWSYRMRAREKNIGWRIDYHCVNREFLPQIRDSAIHADVMGSDHCPVSITIK